MFYKVILFIAFSVIIFLIYNKKNIHIHEIKYHKSHEPEPYIKYNSFPSTYEGFSNKEKIIVNENNAEKHNAKKHNAEDIKDSRMKIYNAYMKTDCKNNFCCEDGMTYSEELGVCIKNNDNSYLNEFNALGPTPPERLNTKQIDKIYKGLDMK